LFTFRVIEEENLMRIATALLLGRFDSKVCHQQKTFKQNFPDLVANSFTILKTIRIGADEHAPWL
jgi:hypothetical protein